MRFGLSILSLGLCVTAHVLKDRGITQRVSFSGQTTNGHVIGGLLARLAGRQSGPCCSGGYCCNKDQFCIPEPGGCCPTGYVFCDDALGACCQPETYCITNGCCPNGKICGFGGGVSTSFQFPDGPGPPSTTTSTNAHTTTTPTAMVTSGGGSATTSDLPSVSSSPFNTSDFPPGSTESVIPVMVTSGPSPDTFSSSTSPSFSAIPTTAQGGNSAENSLGTILSTRLVVGFFGISALLLF